MTDTTITINKTIEVDGIGNYYGGLNINASNDTFYWGIKNHDGIDWDEISEELYKMVLAHHNKKTANDTKEKFINM